LSGNALPENPDNAFPVFKWGWIDARTFRESLENHFEKKPNFLWSAMPNCFYRFGLGEKLGGTNLHCN